MRTRAILKFLVSIGFGIGAAVLLSSLVKIWISPLCSTALSSLGETWQGIVVLLLGIASIISAACFAMAWAVPAMSKSLKTGIYPTLGSRKVLGATAFAMAALGAAFCLIILLSPGGCMRATNWMAATSLVLLICAYTAVGHFMKRHFDDNLRQVSLASEALTMQLLLPVLLVWSGLAHMGLSVEFEPLALLAILGIVTVAGHAIGPARFERESRASETSEGSERESQNHV